jgi:predicted dehydrogenase
MNANQDKPLLCGVIGVGYLGKFHARIYHEMDDVELVGVLDPDDEAATAACDAHGCRRFADLAEMGAACEAVSVVAPTHLHAELSLPLLESGCHLLVEKPLCSTLREAEAIVDAAKQRERIVQVGHVEHYNPVMAFLEETVHSPRYLTGERLAPFQERGTEVGVVLDLMIHDVGIALSLVDSPLERIDAIGVRVLSVSEDIANARLTFANGCVANLNASRVSEKKAREIRVFQDSGYLSLDFMNQNGHVIEKSADGLHRSEVPVEKGEPLALELAEFVRCVRLADTPKTDVVFGKSALEVALDITRLIHEGWKD